MESFADDNLNSLDPCLLGMTVMEFLSQYRGRLQPERLEALAHQIPSIAHGLLKIAEKILQDGYDSEKYREFMNRVWSYNFPDLTFNANIVIQIDQRYFSELEKLNLQLNTNKENLRREMIFDDYTKLGQLYLERGDFTSARKAFLESENYAIGFNQTIQCYINIIRVSLFSQTYASMTPIINQVEQLTLDPSAPQNRSVHSICQAALGLRALQNNDFHDAAFCFLQCTSEIDNNLNEVCLFLFFIFDFTMLLCYYC